MRPYERVVILIKIYIFNFGALCSFGLTYKIKDFFVKIYALATLYTAVLIVYDLCKRFRRFSASVVQPDARDFTDTGCKK